MVVDLIFSLFKSRGATCSSLVNLHSLKNNILPPLTSPLSPFFSLLSPSMARGAEERKWVEWALPLLSVHSRMRERELEEKRKRGKT